MKKLLAYVLIFLSTLNVFAQISCIDSSLIDPTSFCPLIYAPVCGCDGQTYSNSCFAAALGGVTSFTNGACGTIPCVDPTQIDPNVICPAYYNPVCGCNNVTYSNICQAENAGGVTSFTYGPCGYTNPCPNPNIANESFNCSNSFSLNPVCGCDGLTYANECVAETNFGVWDYTLGACNTTDCVSQNQINTFINCGTTYEPVCGCDEVTYNNECEAIYVGGIVNWTAGPCQDPCIDSDLVDLTEICGLAYNPVCGCDGETYFNPCVAQSFFGVSTWSAGVCDPSVCADADQIVATINCSTAATQIICGCDSITYNNACEAFYLGGIQNWTLGSCTNGINDLSEFFEILVKPNPSKNHFFITVNSVKNSDIEISILDLNGKVVKNIFEGNVNNMENNLKVNTNNLLNGIYLIDLKSDKKHLIKKISIFK